MGWAYKESGSFRGFDPDIPDIFTLKEGEKYFEEHPTEAQLVAAFPNREAAILEAVWKVLRDQRTALLHDCDWTDLPTNRQRLGPELCLAWDTYRQALRDLPETTADPRNPAWPTPPQIQN